MPKIKNGLIRKRKEELRAETEQESLREKHHIADRNVMIVEKGSVVRSVACIFGSVVRYCALILLVLLAVIGILAIIYRPFLLLSIYDIMGTSSIPKTRSSTRKEVSFR